MYCVYTLTWRCVSGHRDPSTVPLVHYCIQWLLHAFYRQVKKCTHSINPALPQFVVRQAAHFNVDVRHRVTRPVLVSGVNQVWNMPTSFIKIHQCQIT